MRADFRRAAAVAFLSGCLASATALAATPDVPSLSGRIYGADASTPLEGAQVVAVNLETEQSFAAAPTDPEGRYAVDELPQGYYDVAVHTEQGWFLADRPVRVPEGGSAAVSMSVAPSKKNEADPTTTPSAPPSMRRGRNKLAAFWASVTDPLGGPVAGSAVVVGGLAISGMAASSLLDSDDSTPTSSSASPFVP